MTDPTPDPVPDAVLDAVAEILAGESLRANRFEPWMRRLRRAIRDLGLPVPAEWANVGDDGGVTFGALDARRADQLLCLLEDIAAGRPVRVIAGGGGPALFDVGPPAGPVAPVPASSVHMVVPQ